VSARALDLLGLALLVFSAGRELAIAAPRSDTLLLAFFLLAAGLLVRLLTGGGFTLYPLLGAALGCAYLTKSFAFLPSGFLLAALFVYGLRRKGAERTRLLGGVVVAGVIFSALALPYALAISKQLGHLTTGDSARMNYCFFVDQTPRWHEDYTHDLGHATGAFTHPEQVLATAPPTFSFAQHAVGTFPLWFDPAWWTAGLKPHFWLRGHVARIARCTALLLRYLLGRPEVFVLLVVLLAFGARWQKRTERSTRFTLLASPFAWGLLMLAIYFPIDLQDRYLMAPFLLMVLPAFAGLRGRTHSAVTAITASALVAVLAGLALAQSTTYLLERRRQASLFREGSFGYSPQVTAAGNALVQLGVKPGDKLACFGDAACYLDHYWARLAGAQILAEVQTPDGAPPEAEWKSIADKRTVTAPLEAMGLDVIVGRFPNSAQKPEGWVQLGTTDFFVYPLKLNVR
jgi:hypothetical protein